MPPPVNLMRLLTKRMSEPQTRQKGLRPLHPKDGAPREKEGAEGEKNALAVCFPRAAHAKKACRALVKTGNPELKNTTNAMFSDRSRQKKRAAAENRGSPLVGTDSSFSRA